MPSYAVDSKAQEMLATGIVEEVTEWREGADGKRQRTDVQARNEDTGMPLWGVEVIYRTEQWGRKSTVTARVTVGAETRPALGFMSPITFTNLHVDVRVNKAGGLVETWRAESIDSATDRGTERGGKAAAEPKAAA